MIGQTLGHYRVVEKIGAGGMGEVYRAHDERLDRDVALKVLPAGTLADDAARKRFRKEALALSRLNHPNIATIFDFDTQNGVDFLVMEYLPGDTLAEKLGAGPLPEREVARLGAQIASALEEAHDQNVVHRDLKPGNVVLTPKGQAKVLDFGLAKTLRPGGAQAVTADSFTESRAAAGTLPYMAPEQVRGEGVDSRTDIYALGCVLYELATGQRPFRETHGGRLMDAILHAAPAPPSRFQPRLSADLERLILKCLEKDPDDRYQSAKEVGVDLKRLGAPATAVAAARPATATPRWLLAALG
ncbi:MAG: serine/threonine-protein kinase, partial [Candidatus Acidiferrales bacterium]